MTAQQNKHLQHQLNSLSHERVIQFEGIVVICGTQIQLKKGDPALAIIGKAHNDFFFGNIVGKAD